MTANAPPARACSSRGHQLFNAVFEALRFRYVGLLDWSLRHRGRVLLGVRTFFVASLGLAWLVGEDFFPAVDSGQMRLHARAPAGTRIEETEMRFAAIEREIRAAIPPDEIDMLIDNIGIPNSWPSIAQGDIPTISSADGEILISLNKEKHGSTRDYEVLLRKRLRERFPDMTFFFQPANITSQILNFGLPAPIDVQVVGRERRRQLRDRAEAGREDFAHSGGGRRPCSPGGRPAGNPPGRGSREGIADGTDAARRHQQHADLAQRQRHGGAEFLDELDQRRQLQRRRADAAIPHRFAGRPAAHSDLGGDQRRQQHDAGFAGGRVGGGNRFRRRFAERRVAGLRKSRSRWRAARNCSPTWSRCSAPTCR